MRLILLALLSGSVLTLAACDGQKTQAVSGKVTYNGQSVPEGYIAFIPEGAPGKGGGGPITNGEYSVRAQVGNNRVEITASKKMPLPPGEVGMEGATEETRQYIPEKYNAKSELKATIPHSGPLNFELKD